ncbi:hypothetical protein BXZ70DRAFT_489188 [Cristinia sonorae]|uniref:Uncharacterized protein n=1 Tax=Cristinia sonorae TaxID=1940300 RepID=A0A8K0UHQ8_9AGAR|nr:hypothetical protein BXZ70DRAFT_489188 [Cristinia sonorae]
MAVATITVITMFLIVFFTYFAAIGEPLALLLSGPIAFLAPLKHTPGQNGMILFLSNMVFGTILVLIFFQMTGLTIPSVMENPAQNPEWLNKTYADPNTLVLFVWTISVAIVHASPLIYVWYIRFLGYTTGKFSEEQWGREYQYCVSSTEFFTYGLLLRSWNWIGGLLTSELEAGPELKSCDGCCQSQRKQSICVGTQAEILV